MTGRPRLEIFDRVCQGGVIDITGEIGRRVMSQLERLDHQVGAAVAVLVDVRNG